MTTPSTSKTTRWGIWSLIVLFACVPICTSAEDYYEDDYYYEEDYYYSYESTIYDAFSSNTTPDDGMKGRRNLWEDEYDENEHTHPGDPLPLGDGTIMLLFAAMMAGLIYIKQRKQKQLQSIQSTTNNHHDTNNMTTRKHTSQSLSQKLFMLLIFCSFAANTFAWKPIMIGHKGCRQGVENTEQAFINGVTVYGFQGLECDVKMTKDGHYVCWHDNNLKTGGHESVVIAEKTLAELQALTLTQSRWKSQTEQSTKIPYTGKICTVDRYLEICKQYNVIPVIELKENTTICSANMEGFPGLYALIEKHGLVNKAIILTSMKGSLTYIKEHYPQLKRQYLTNGILSAEGTTELIDFCVANGCDISACYSYNATRYVKPADVVTAHNAGINVAFWTMNLPADYQKYGNYAPGPNYITSDDFVRTNLPELSGTDPNLCKKSVRAQTYMYDSETSTWKWKDSNQGGTFSMTHSEGTVYNHTTNGYVKDIPINGLIPATFQATANSGYTFIGWWNNPTVYTDNPWVLERPEEYKESVTARFAQLHTQTILITNNGGSVDIAYHSGVENTNASTTNASTSYKVLTQNLVTLTATPNSGYEFVGWMDGANMVSSNNTYQYKATADKNITAKFAEIIPTTPGNFRLKYVEQTPISKTEIHEDYFIYSDEVEIGSPGKEDVVSMHIFNRRENYINNLNNPEIILQQYNGTEWVDIERHMVFGPLKTNKGGVIKMPTRRNATEIPSIIYDKGIEMIAKEKDDPEKDYGCGVWDFIIVQDGTTATIDLNRVKRYEGPYYIRTASAAGGYNDYTNEGNLVNFSEYAYSNYGRVALHEFTHYFCNDIQKSGTNLTFTVANDHSSALAYDLKINNQRFNWDAYGDDQYVTNSDGEPLLLLPENEDGQTEKASVRFGWDIITNRLTRAYIADTKERNNDYLTIQAKVSGKLEPKENHNYFYDNTDWMYSIDLLSELGAEATVKAKFNGKDQIFWKDFHFLGGTNDGNKYPIRVLFDFRHHRFTTIYVPDSELNGEVNIQTPVMILREHNNPATQITFTSNQDKLVATGDDKEDDRYTYPAYAVLTFLEDKFATNVTTTSHYEKMFYWVSFPFDVNLKDVFGLGEYGNYWAVEYYNGEKRAAQGLPASDPTGWEYVAETKEEAATKQLKANQGYVVCLNYKRLCKDYGFTAGGGRKISIYFPSADKVREADIKNQEDPVTVTLPSWEKGEKVAWNHWDWHLVGIPSFATPGVEHNQGDVRFVYEYWHPTDGYAPKAANEIDWYPMHSYIMQYAGDITWNSIVNITPSALAARQDAATEEPTLRLELQKAGQWLDQTYVQLLNDEVTLGFDLNKDLTKMLNNGANIYSVVSGDQMAGNCILNAETTLPLGVVISEAGEYTFTMPAGTAGMVVELIDYEAGTSTNLLMGDYTITLPKGTFNNRFALSIRPDKVATGVENIGEVPNGSDGATVRKFIIDGKLYLQQGNLLYDAQGHIVR